MLEDKLMELAARLNHIARYPGPLEVHDRDTVRLAVMVIEEMSQSSFIENREWIEKAIIDNA